MFKLMHVSIIWVCIIAIVCLTRFIHKHCSHRYVELFSNYSTILRLEELDEQSVGILNRFLHLNTFNLENKYCKENIKSYYIDPNNLKKTKNNVVYTPILHKNTYFNPKSKQCENTDNSPVKKRVNCNHELIKCKNIANNDIYVLGQNETIDFQDACSFKECSHI